jgi:hypothetical protein
MVAQTPLKPEAGWRTLFQTRLQRFAILGQRRRPLIFTGEQIAQAFSGSA